MLKGTTPFLTYSYFFLSFPESTFLSFPFLFFLLLLLSLFLLLFFLPHFLPLPTSLSLPPPHTFSSCCFISIPFAMALAKVKHEEHTFCCHPVSYFLMFRVSLSSKAPESLLQARVPALVTELLHMITFSWLPGLHSLHIQSPSSPCPLPERSFGHGIRPLFLFSVTEFPLLLQFLE